MWQCIPPPAGPRSVLSQLPVPPAARSNAQWGACLLVERETTGDGWWTSLGFHTRGTAFPSALNGEGSAQALGSAALGFGCTMCWVRASTVMLGRSPPQSLAKAFLQTAPVCKPHTRPRWFQWLCSAHSLPPGMKQDCVTLRVLSLLRRLPGSTSSELPSCRELPLGALVPVPSLAGWEGVLYRSEHCVLLQHSDPSTLTTLRLQGAECSKSPPGQKVTPGQISLGWLHCPSGLSSPFVRGAEGKT